MYKFGKCLDWIWIPLLFSIFVVGPYLGSVFGLSLLIVIILYDFMLREQISKDLKEAVRTWELVQKAVRSNRNIFEDLRERE